MARSFIAFGSYLTVIVLLAASCKPKMTNVAATRNNGVELPPLVTEKLAAFEANPDEAHFQEIVGLARDSSDTRLSTLVDYVQYSKKCMPVDDPTVNMTQLEARLKTRSSNDFRLVEEIMPQHKHLWRRWTMAKFLGDFGDKSSIPTLQKLFDDHEEYVRKTAREAVSNINSR